MKKRKTAKFTVALGQVGLLMSVLFLAVLIGLVPDRVDALRQGRAALSESIAISVSDQVQRNVPAQTESSLNLLAERNDDLVSIGLRQKSGELYVSVGDHEENWTPMTQEYSTESQVMVPIYEGQNQWGQIELRFQSQQGWFGIEASNTQVIPLMTFMALASFFVFYFYLGKMLKHLDPSRAIPQRVRSALDTMAEGLLVVDRKGQIVLANRAIAGILDKEVDELLGLTTDDLGWAIADDQTDTQSTPPWERCLSTGDPQRNDVVHMDDGRGQKRTFIVNCSPVLVSDKKLGGALISLDDVTQLEEKKKELGVAKEAAEAANKSKSEFLANMSHEIRTPMNAILGFTDVLRRGYGKSVRNPQKYLNTIHSSGTHLLGLINDILDLSKVESGRMDIERIRCAPHEIIEDVVQVLNVKANEKGISLSLEVEGSVPESIQSDPARIRQIVTNLVGNAIKFTSEGGVKIVLSFQTDGPEEYMIQVCDSGIGMGYEQLNRIFDPFSQADSSVNRRFGGTGLGLTISKRFADALGGGIDVSSEPEVGSVFTVRLAPGPIDDVKWVDGSELGRTRRDAYQPEAKWVFGSKRVLVVDDGQANRDLISIVLNEVGLDVVVATNGKEGVEKALAQSFDLILMDMQMPVMDGYLATSTLRSKGYEAPIFALTADAMQGAEQKCRDAGCTGFLTKPIVIDELLKSLGEVLGGVQCEVEEDHAERGWDPIASENSSELESQSNDESPIYSRLPTEVDEFRDIVAQFIAKLPGKLLEMAKATEKEDFEELGLLAHWLKGAGGTVGFDSLTKPAEELEEAAREGVTDNIVSCLQNLVGLSRRLRVQKSEVGCAT